MGRTAIIAGTIIVIVAAGYVLIAWLRKLASKEKAADKGWALKGDLNRIQEREIIERLEQGAALLRDLATPPNSLALTSTLLSPEDRGRVEAWLRAQNATMKGISPR